MVRSNTTQITQMPVFNSTYKYGRSRGGSLVLSKEIDTIRIMSRTVCIVLLVATVAVAIVSSENVELYSDKYDYVNADEILANDRLRDQYFNCFTGAGPCLTPDAKFFGGNFPESLVTQCKRCTERQKIMFDKVVVWYTENRPEEWKKAVEIFIEAAKKKKTVS
ncbi:ejaculatory bulb-specific protein 3 [Cephus cinctus]|uniref:Ejaculatory bulb-specific protein 3 n=1 Tax=Cephus cinctus TaxID=211228 RepID=A0AAJ7BSA4_CEPCN|nr:ejaculatory bulb-specific protein 3 [Cephus cinctus]